MKRQFDKKHGAREVDFKIHDTVYARDYKDPNHPRWVSGRIMAKIGRTVYDVNIDGRIVRRHTNQLRPRSTDQAMKEMLGNFELTLPTQTARQKSFRFELPEEEISETPETENAVPEAVVEDPVTAPVIEDNIIPVVDEPEQPNIGPESKGEHREIIPEGSPTRRSKRARKPPTRLIVEPSNKFYN
ncbi:hypothetical protein ACDT12_12935 [Staphylococcus aureus]